MKEVVIIGYGGHGYVATDILLQSGYNVIGYCDTEEKQSNPFVLPYFGPESVFFSTAQGGQTPVFVSIGSTRTREKVFNFLTSISICVVNAIHPKAVVAQKVTLGKGVMIAANASVNPLCTIADGVICNTSSSIDHECEIGEFTHICPGTVLCGNVTVGKCSFIGANSVVKPGVTIGNGVIIGAGSTVIKDITEPGIYFGSPAKRKKGSRD